MEVAERIGLVSLGVLSAFFWPESEVRFWDGTDNDSTTLTPLAMAVGDVTTLPPRARLEWSEVCEAVALMIGMGEPTLTDLRCARLAELDPILPLSGSTTILKAFLRVVLVTLTTAV